MGAIPSGLLGAAGLAGLPGISLPMFLAAHLLSWFLCDWLVLIRLRGRSSPGDAAFWLLREALAFPLWIHIAIGNTVNCRRRASFACTAARSRCRAPVTPVSDT